MTTARAWDSRLGRGLGRLSGLVFLLCVCLALGTCGPKGKKNIIRPLANLPPLVESVNPAARSVSILYDAPAWVQFKEPMDPATINERTVFLKLDTQRIPANITYDASTHRITITPRVALALLRTHTVELAATISSADHVPLGQTYFWQFRVIGVRRPSVPSPVSGVTQESPFAALTWSATDAGLGDVVYRIYIGPDSAEVADRVVAPIETRAAGFYLPTRAWPLQTVFYWSVLARNETTGEQLDGPVWRFETLPEGTAVDSMTVLPQYWGYFLRIGSRQLCNSALASGPDYNTALHYPLRALPQDLRLASAYIALTPSATTNLAAREPALYPTQGDWVSCQLGYPGPPYIGDPGLLSKGVVTRILGVDRYWFQSDTLTAFIEAAIKRPGFNGFIMRSNISTGYLAPVSAGPLTGQLKLYYYRASASSSGAGIASRR